MSPLDHAGDVTGHQIHDRLHQQMHLHELLLTAGLSKRLVDPEAGVVHQDVDVCAELLDARRQSIALLRLGQVCGHGHGPFLAAELTDQLVQALLAPGDQHDPISLLGQLTGELLADS